MHSFADSFHLYEANLRFIFRFVIFNIHYFVIFICFVRSRNYFGMTILFEMIMLLLIILLQLLTVKNKTSVKNFQIFLIFIKKFSVCDISFIIKVGLNAFTRFQWREFAVCMEAIINYWFLLFE